MLVHQIIRHNPDQIAFLATANVDYGQLNRMVEEYRSYFYHHGVRPGDNVGLFAKNSPDFVACYLAVVSLGAVIVPLNFQLVPREIAYIIHDAAIKTLITMSCLELSAELDRLGYPGPLSQLLISDFSGITGQTFVPPCPNSCEDDLCTIIYTSGTTGFPKGAMLSHRNLISNAQAFSAASPHSPADRFLCVLPMYHCFAWTVAVLTPLLNGSGIKILETFSIRETISAIRENGLTVVAGIPTMFRLFSQWAVPADFVTVRLFISGGASLPQEVSEQFSQKFGIKVTEGYGLSEASPVVSLNPVEQVKYCSVGKPLPGITVEIADTDGKLLAPQQIGELLVRGPNVMLGYYNLPAESAKALQHGWLHTGDMAYLDHDGYIFIVDRLKDMIITSGENIYPREIEEVLYAYPAVAEAAVIGVPDKLRGNAVHAYIVPQEGQVLDKKELQSYLQQKIAPYKMPREFFLVQGLPKSSTGKILKTELRQQALEKPCR